MPSFASAWFCRSFVSASSAFVERLKKEKASCLDDMAEGSMLVQTRKAQTLLLVLWILVQGD
jgi:hypothetical protein